MCTKLRTFGAAEFYRTRPTREVPMSFAAKGLRIISSTLASIAAPKVAAEGGPLKLLCSDSETLAAKVLPMVQCPPWLRVGARGEILSLRHRKKSVCAQASAPERLRARRGRRRGRFRAQNRDGQIARVRSRGRVSDRLFLAGLSSGLTPAVRHCSPIDPPSGQISPTDSARAT